MNWRNKVILAKMGSGAYPTDPVPTGAANAILASNVSFVPMDGGDVARNLERAFFGAQENLPIQLHATLTFDVEMVGSGELGTPPGWGPLHRMCSCAETIVADTSVEYTPITNNPEWGQIYINISGVLFKLPGARGNWVNALSAQGIPVWRYTFKGLFVQPAASAAPTPVFDLFQTPQVASHTNTPVFTINGASLVLRSWEFDRGAQVEGRFLIGKEEIIIGDGVEKMKVQVEAPALGTYNPYTAPLGAPVPIVLVHGTTDETRVEFEVPLAKQRRPASLAQEQGIIEYPLDYDPLPNTGNDQWTIRLAAAA